MSAELGNLLDYLKTGHPTDDFTEECRKEVERLRFDDEWRENYMTLEMKMDERYEAGVEAGMEAGIQKGKTTILQSLIEKKLEKGKTIEQIADECEESVETIRKCINELHLSS